MHYKVYGMRYTDWLAQLTLPSEKPKETRRQPTSQPPASLGNTHRVMTSKKTALHDTFDPPYVRRGKSVMKRCPTLGGLQKK